MEVEAFALADERPDAILLAVSVFEKGQSTLATRHVVLLG